MTPTITISRRDPNSNYANGRDDCFVVECNGWPLDIDMGEACVIHAAAQKGPEAAFKAFEKMLARRRARRVRNAEGRFPA